MSCVVEFAHGDVFEWGSKYGEKIEHVINEDVEYILWCFGHVKGFKIDDSLYKLYRKRLKDLKKGGG